METIDNKKENQTEKESEEGKQDFVELLLGAIGMDLDGISKKIEELEKARNDKDPVAYIGTLDSLLNLIGESTGNAAPEIEKIKRKAIEIIKPLIDLFIKDSLIDTLQYAQEMKVDAYKRTTDVRKEIYKLEAKSLFDQVTCLVEAGFTKKESLDLIKTKLGRPPQNISFSPTMNKALLSNQRSKEQIVNDFIKLTKDNPETLLKVLSLVQSSFSGRFPTG